MELINIIRQVGIFIICAQTLIHFRPNESYGKYMRLLVSVMVLVQLVLPIMSFFQMGNEELFRESIASYEVSMQEQMNQVNVTGVMAVEKLKTMTQQELEDRIASQEAATQETATQETVILNDTAINTATTSEGEVEKIDEVRIEVGTDEVE